MMTMVFAVEEINRNPRLLPGVKLGYRTMDSCDHVHTSMHALFSLISHSKTVTTDLKLMEETENKLNMTKERGTRIEMARIVQKTRKKRMLKTVLHNLENNVGENVTEGKVDRGKQSETLYSCLAGSSVPVVIGLASSSPTRAVAHTLGPLNIPLVRNEQLCTLLYFCCSFPALLGFVRNHKAAFENV